MADLLQFAYLRNTVKSNFMNKAKNSSLFTGKNGENYLYPFVLITILFFLWGFAHSLLDVLNKHFQDSLHLSKAESGIVQVAAYGAYFLTAIPAGMVAQRYGYKRGILVGLTLFAVGAFWFVPAVMINAFWAFLLGLLILFAGLTFLETVANPYTTLLGPPETAASRINLAQTFNALGWIMGPIIGSVLIFKNTSNQSVFSLYTDAVKKVFFGIVSTVEQISPNESSASDNSSLLIPYVGLGILVLAVLILFSFAKLPEVTDTDSLNLSEKQVNSIFHQRHFVLAIVAQFLYVAAQTGIGSFFINYTIEVKQLQLTEIQGGLLLGFGGMVIFAIGRLVGSMLMKKVNAGNLLGLFALINTLLMLLVIVIHNRFGVIALIGSYFFMSIMFPSIFALGLRGLGEKTKTASSILILTIVGGAVAPVLMGKIGATNMSIGFIVPLICFLYISFYGFVGSKIKN